MKVPVLAAVLVVGLVLGALSTWAILRAPATPTAPKPPAVLNYGPDGCPQGYVPMKQVGPEAAGPCEPGTQCDWCVRKDLLRDRPAYLPAELHSGGRFRTENRTESRRRQ